LAALADRAASKREMQVPRQQSLRRVGVGGHQARGDRRKGVAVFGEDEVASLVGYATNLLAGSHLNRTEARCTVRPSPDKGTTA